jgi:hypothetical protein
MRIRRHSRSHLIKKYLSVLSDKHFKERSRPGYVVSVVFIERSMIMTILFLGFCVLIVIAQLVPAITLLFGMCKGINKSKIVLAK